MITKVTITGADDSVHPKELVELQKEFPFAEWGILMSGSTLRIPAQPRFPSVDWLTCLFHVNQSSKSLGTPLNLSAHLCGSYVKDLLKGDASFFTNHIDVVGMFKRVQINTHGVPHKFDKDAFVKVLRVLPFEFIFQIDNANEDLVMCAADAKNIKYSGLYDLSHGAGILPEAWPKPSETFKCGYAGGLGPDNLDEQIGLIGGLTIGREIWIDMETKVRSDNDYEFDLDKVRKCLEISAKYVGK